MGGDFLLSEAGKVLLSHPSKNPHDRPSVTDILRASDPAGGSTSPTEEVGVIQQD